jgi:hypothetical protein
MVVLPFTFTLMLPGVEVTVYPVMVEFPLLTGGDHEIVALASDDVANTFLGSDGAVGIIAGVMEFDGPDAMDVPTELVAVTVNVYIVPFVKPVTMADETSGPTVAVNPPGFDVTV